MSYRARPVVALIPARGGSKGILKKNIALCAGKPLLQYTIEAAAGAKNVDKIIVSSDCDEILAVAEQLGALPLRRPASMASDEASSHPLIGHAIEELGGHDSYIILLQPTSPLRTSAHIDQAFDRLTQQGADNLASVHLMKETPYKAYKLMAEGYLEAFMGEGAPYQRRQDIPKVYYPNGAIYIFLARDFLKGNKIPSVGVIPFEMPIEDSIDIDNLSDLQQAERILRTRLNE